MVSPFGRTDGQTDRRMVGRSDGRTVGRTDVRPSVRPSARSCVRPSVRSCVRPHVRPSSPVRPFARPFVRRPSVRPSALSTGGPQTSSKFSLEMLPSPADAQPKNFFSGGGRHFFPIIIIFENWGACRAPNPLAERGRAAPAPPTMWGRLRTPCPRTPW